MRAAWVVVVVVACLGCGGGNEVPIDARPPDAVPPPGSDAGSRSGCSLTQPEFFTFSTDGIAAPMAAGGAKIFVLACVQPGGRWVRSAATTDPRVATVRLDDTWSGRALAQPDFPGDQYELTVFTGAPGDTDLVLYDPDGAEVLRTTIHVLATTDLVVDQGWGDAAGPTVLAGTSQCLRAITERDTEVLAGSGAVQFAYSGGISDDVNDAADCGSLFAGDAGHFVAGVAGQGTVTASCPDASATVPVTVVGPEALTSVVAPAAVSFTRGAGLLSVGALAGATPVYGVTCAWTAPAALTISRTNCEFTLSADDPCNDDQPAPTGFLGGGAPTLYAISGPGGDYEVRCDLPGGLTASIAVHIDP